MKLNVLPIIILITVFSSLIHALPKKIILELPQGKIEFVDIETDPTLAKRLIENNGYIKEILEDEEGDEEGKVIIPLNAGEALPIFEALEADIEDQLKEYLTAESITLAGKDIKQLEQLGDIANFLDNQTLLDAVALEIDQQKNYPSLCKIFGDDAILHNNHVLTNLMLKLKPFVLTKIPIRYKTLTGHTNGISSLAKLNERTLASGSSDQTIRIWDVTTGQTTNILQEHTNAIFSLAKLNEHTLASGSLDRTIIIWDITAGQATATLDGHALAVFSLATLNEHTLASGSADYTIIIWNITTGQATRILLGHTGIVSALAKFNEHTLASGSADNTIRIWDLTTGRTIRELTGHSDYVVSLAKLNEHTLASGSWDHTIMIWDITTGQTIRKLTGHSDAIFSLAKLNEHTLASGSGDNTIRIWDLITGQTICKLTGHTKEIYSLAKLNEHTLASGSGDNTIRIWDLTTFNRVITSLENLTCIQLITLYNILNKLPLTIEQHNAYTTLDPAIKKAFPIKQSSEKSGLTLFYNKFKKR